MTRSPDLQTFFILNFSFLNPLYPIYMQLGDKQAALEARLRGLGRVLVAYSGGIDSAFLAWAAHRALGDAMLAVIADSASLARTQLEDALAFAHEESIPV